MLDSRPHKQEAFTLERKRRDFNNTDINHIAMNYEYQASAPKTSPFMDPFTYSASPMNNEDRNSAHSMIRDIVIYNQTTGHPIYKDQAPFGGASHTDGTQDSPLVHAQTKSLHTRRSIHQVAPAQAVPPTTTPGVNLLQVDRR